MNNRFMNIAIELSIENVRSNKGGPFGAVIVKNNEIIATGVNQVTATNDPTAHAEMVAIRNACKALQSFQLIDCHIYTSCEPCPMCFGAIFWARPSIVYFANTAHDAAKIGFDDHFIYEQLACSSEQRSIPFKHIVCDDALKAFELWQKNKDKINY